MAKIVQFTQFGGAEVLQIIEKDLGKPNAGDVKLAIKSIGLNRAETLLREDKYIFSPELLRNVHGIIYRNYNVGFLFQMG